MTTIGTIITTWFSCNIVGTDAFGNRYYVSKKPGADGKLRRSVLYKGIVEASKIPPVWHGWLHYITDTLPEQLDNYSWQKAPLPNLTGTKLAYRPMGHVTQGGKRRKATGDYDAWTPK